MDDEAPVIYGLEFQVIIFSFNLSFEKVDDYFITEYRLWFMWLLKNIRLLLMLTKIKLPYCMCPYLDICVSKELSFSSGCLLKIKSVMFLI